MKNNTQDPVVIVASARTPMGAFLGAYNSISTTELGATLIEYLCNVHNLKNLTSINEVIMGCVLPAGLGQAPARQAVLKAGLPNTVPCTTVNKMCGSGLKAIIQAYNNILANSSVDPVIIAGGMENMSQAPYLIPKARNGLRLGHGTIIDHMFIDGLEDAYNPGCLMGYFAEATAKKYNFTRSMQDEFAYLSGQKAIAAVKNNYFAAEICPVKYKYNSQEINLSVDETVEKISGFTFEKITKLKPAFVKPQDIATGTVTAANSSSIADGAAGVVLMRLSNAKRLSLTPLAKIVGYAEVAHEPEWFTTAPGVAIAKLLKQNNLKSENIDLFEINEAFAVVTMAAIADLNLDPAKVNIHGGACALGHPIGASGSRIIVTLLNALLQTKKCLGVASLCIGGGEAIALAIEVI